MSQHGIVIKKDLKTIIDCFDVLKYTSFTDWEISAKEGEVVWWGEYEEIVCKEEEIRKKEKAKVLKEKIHENFKNSRYNEALIQMDEFFSLIDCDDDISNLKEKINDIFNIKGRIKEARINSDFQEVQEKLAELLELNKNDENAYEEKVFLEEALPFLDESFLETIDSLEECQDYIATVSKLIMQAPGFYTDDLEGIKTQLLGHLKEYKRKEKIKEFNCKIKLALMVDNYEEVLALFEEAQQYLKSEDEITFTREQCEECEKTEKEIQHAIDEKNFTEAANLLKRLQSINPDSKKVKLKLGDFERYFSLCAEIEDEKDPGRLFEKIRKKEKELDQFPKYLEEDLKKLMKESKNRIEKEKKEFQSQAEERWGKRKYAAAAELLKKAALIEFDKEKKGQMISDLRKIETDIEEADHLRRKRFVYGAGFGIAILTIILLAGVLEKSNTKKKINHLLSEVRPLIETRQFAEAKVKLNQLFAERQKLKQGKDIDININGILEMLYLELMKSSNPGTEEKENNYINNMIKKAEKTRGFFSEFPGYSRHFTGKWFKKAVKILDLSKTFNTSIEEKKSGKALNALVELKSMNGENPVPFELLHEVAYRNDHGPPVVTLGGIEFVFIKGGTFEIGWFNTEDNSLSMNAPLVSKTLSSFWISKTEITISQYKKEKLRGKQGELPQANINWSKASNFAIEFGKEYGLNSNLPTEAQWEYAARNGGEKIIYPWGNTIDCSHANYRDCEGEVKPVGSYPPNRSGTYDLAGNLKEWCRDVYHRKAYTLTDSKDPYCQIGEGTRVVRGGSFADSASELKNHSRFRKYESSQDIYTGFRIVLENK